MARIKLEDIQAELEPFGWQVLSTTYVNLNTPLEFKCAEGHEFQLPYKSVRGKYECPICKKNTFKQMNDEIQPKKKGTFRVLALDQATHDNGWAVYDNAQLIAYGIFHTRDGEEIDRDHQVKHWLLSMIASWHPDLIGLEGIQMQQNVEIFATLARLQGILMETCYDQNIAYQVCHTGVWRQHCGVKGTSRADKKMSMQMLVKQWFDISVRDDASDAIGIGKYVADTNINQYKITKWE